MGKGNENQRDCPVHSIIGYQTVSREEAISWNRLFEEKICSSCSIALTKIIYAKEIGRELQRQSMETMEHKATNH
jgi:hypothetical protein